MSAAVPGLLQLQYEVESKAAKWYITTETANTFFLYSYSTRVQVTVCFLLHRHPVHLETTVPAVEMHLDHLSWIDQDCTGERCGAPEHLQYTNDIIIWGNTEEAFEKGKEIYLDIGFAIERSKIKGPA